VRRGAILPWSRLPVPRLVLPAILVVACAGCAGENAPPPDDLLRETLGLTEDDAVHRVVLTSDSVERARPSEVVVRSGDFVEFVTDDWKIHEVIFELDSLATPARTFLVDSDQVESPPLLDRGVRYVLSFRDAPEGRYPYRVEGNAPATHGVIIVRYDD